MASSLAEFQNPNIKIQNPERLVIGTWCFDIVPTSSRMLDEIGI